MRLESEKVENLKNAPLMEVFSAGEATDPFVEDGEKDSHEDLWDSLKNEETLEQQMVQFVYENPGRSHSALFAYFREAGFPYADIRETYNTLLYDKKILQRLNVGTDKSPRYAHFVAGLFAFEPKRDVLYDVLGPI
ncbi:MAG: hypothetical protein HXS44_09785 [Theionarchaea archaeon]|nr:hypothetical protein [Theionarchaea archaeon]